MKIRKIFGWLFVVLSVSGLLQLIVLIVTIFVSDTKAEQAVSQLPSQLFVLIAFVWISHWLLAKKKDGGDTQEDNEVTCKLTIWQKSLIYFFEAIIAIIGGLVLSVIAFVITNSVFIMQMFMSAGILGIIYLLPSPEDFWSYWRKRK